MTMHLDFGRSGGIAGITLTARVSIDDLPPEPATIARSLWDGQVSTAPGPPPAAVRDAFDYRLELRVGDRRERYRWPSGGVPDALAPLVSALTRLAAADRP